MGYFCFSDRFRWDTCPDFLAVQHLSDIVRVVGLVCQQFLDAVNIFSDKLLSLLAIARMAWRKTKINRFLFYIGYHMYLCISASFGKADLARLTIGFKAASRAMRLGKSGIYRCNVVISQHLCAGVENFTKNFFFAPANETFPNCIVITIPYRDITPVTAMLHHPYYAADNYDRGDFLVAARGWQMFCKFVKNFPFNQGYFHSC